MPVPIHPFLPMKPAHRLSILCALLSTPLACAAQDALVDQIPAVFERAASQYDLLRKNMGGDTKMPRTTNKDGAVVTVRHDDWTSGFYPGCLWFLHEYDQSPKWRDLAMEATNRLESIRHFKGNHDGGFMLGCSFGNALRLAPDETQRQVLRDAAAALATRFVPEIGMIRSWDHKPYGCPVIIDNMMNLELLSWAAKNGGENKLRDIAVSHADKTLRQHFRPDGTAYHVVDYDPKTGWIRAYHATQGADVRSAWARGQAWALYGFTMMHRETGKPEYLELAGNLAKVLINHSNMPKDKVPYWDFGVHGETTPRDASAAAIMASALIELSQLVKDGSTHLDYARAQLLTLSSPAFLAAPGTNGGFILTRSTGHLPANSEINVPLIYADYYYLEALLRYRALAKGTNRTHFGQTK
jgi:unsaturated chondroitin disaccharide hydrolase